MMMSLSFFRRAACLFEQLRPTHTSVGLLCPDVCRHCVVERPGLHNLSLRTRPNCLLGAAPTPFLVSTLPSVRPSIPSTRANRVSFRVRFVVCSGGSSCCETLRSGKTAAVWSCTTWRSTTRAAARLSRQALAVHCFRPLRGPTSTRCRTWRCCQAHLIRLFVG